MVTDCLMLFPLYEWAFVAGPCFVMLYFEFFLALHSSRNGGERLLLSFNSVCAYVSVQTFFAMPWVGL